ncbi:TfoX/Sxy family protein [Desulfotomaculum sp. 1211_IL3151]|uniref:TfoX/Sxy family protein n=1 Tax=Desulfotomaculum sp. 1211_IL3151 TaxID=3084055 RepID=UPI002FDA5D1E
MASSEEFTKYVAEQLSGAGTITYKKMFGEYGLYCNGKFFASVCDNQLFVKITDKGREVLRNPEMASPYEGAKPSFLITELEDKELLCRLATATCKALPEPRPKKRIDKNKEDN